MPTWSEILIESTKDAHNIKTMFLMLFEENTLFNFLLILDGIVFCMRPTGYSQVKIHGVCQLMTRIFKDSWKLSMD